MSMPSAKLLVLVGEQFACVRIVGRANFMSSIDFKTLLNELGEKGYDYFMLDLTDCALMDSTFLGVLAGFGLKLNSPQREAGQTGSFAIELLNPNPRITELLENLGVLHLFKLVEGPVALPPGVGSAPCASATTPSHQEITRACLEAHQTLMAINPENISRFKEVAQFLAEDLKKLKS
jgi:anti-anti-sigma regulatory factor